MTCREAKIPVAKNLLSQGSFLYLHAQTYYFCRKMGQLVTQGSQRRNIIFKFLLCSVFYQKIVRSFILRLFLYFTISDS